MRTIILSSAAALALATMPAIAQDTSADPNAAATTQALPPDQAPPEQPVPDQAAPPPQSADRANAENPPAPPVTTVETPAASGAGSVVTTYAGNDSGPPASALNKRYPVCSRTVQDECQNPGEGGAPGRSRALRYWPGHPASEGK